MVYISHYIWISHYIYITYDITLYLDISQINQILMWYISLDIQIYGIYIYISHYISSKCIPMKSSNSHQTRLAFSQQLKMARIYPLVNIQKTMENHHAFFMGKLTISMAIFHSYVTNYQRVPNKKWCFSTSHHGLLQGNEPFTRLDTSKTVAVSCSETDLQEGNGGC